jgi:membrane-associated protease RseP (regulator of RpoE activity)
MNKPNNADRATERSAPAPVAPRADAPLPRVSTLDGRDLTPGPGINPGTAPSQSAAIVRLLLVLAGIAVIAVEAHVGKTVLVLLAIIMMIVLHEFGHYTMAKLGKIKVTEFFVGFGPRLWSIRKGETEYGIKALPLGGYVKTIGMNSLEEVDPADESRTYRQAPFWRRISVAVAGSAMHFLLALLMLFTIFFVIGDQGLFTSTVPGTNLRVAQIDALVTGPSPAHDAGFRVGDDVLGINGKVFATEDALTAYIRSQPGKRLDVLVKRAGKEIHLYPTTVDLSKVKAKATPGSSVPTATKPYGFIGFQLDPLPVKYGFFESVSKSGGTFVHIGAETFGALGQLFSLHGISSYANMLVSKKAADAPNAVRFESPVGITVIASQAAKQGFEDVLSLLILINIFFGIFNMVPLLPLDGGHVAIAVYEKVRSRRGRRYYADVAKMMPFVYATLAVIAFIGVSALFLDLRDQLAVIGFIRF